MWAEGLASGTKAPDFSLKDTNSRTFKLSAFKGRVVFINFFATWCPPCRREFPEVVKLNNNYASKGVKIVSISVDSGQTLNRVKPFAQQNKATQQVLLGAGTEKVAGDYKVQGIPCNYLIGKDGKVAKNWVGFSGPKDADAWRNAIDAALKRK